MDLFHAFDVARLALIRKSCEPGFLLRISFASLGTKFALGDRQDGLKSATICQIVQVDIVQLVVLFFELSGASLLEDAGCLSNGVIIQKLGLSSDSVLDVVFEATEVRFVDHVRQLLLHSFNFLSDFNLPLTDQGSEAALLSVTPLADGVVEDELVALNGLAALALDVHLVPSAVFASLLEQLHRETRHLALLADVCAQVVTLLLQVGLAGDVDHEVVPVELLNVGDSLVLLEQLSEVVLDSSQLLHDLVSEVALSLLVGLLELDYHELRDSLKLADGARLGLGEFFQFLAL